MHFGDGPIILELVFQVIICDFVRQSGNEQRLVSIRCFARIFCFWVPFRNLFLYSDFGVVQLLLHSLRFDFNGCLLLRRDGRIVVEAMHELVDTHVVWHLTLDDGFFHRAGWARLEEAHDRRG